ncbi:MAG TPA: PqqD family protein [Ktedonobacterales bacterium]|nr:PqqD family protein [Ktedonobacterales bacterium]
MIGSETRPQHGKHVVVKQGKNELMLLNSRTGHYYTLDDVGITIWNLCDGTRTVSEIVAAVIQEYDAPAATVEADVLELLKDLADEQLVYAD